MNISEYKKESETEEKIFTELMEKAKNELNLTARFKYYNRARLHLKISEALKKLIELEGQNNGS